MPVFTAFAPRVEEGNFKVLHLDTCGAQKAIYIYKREVERERERWREREVERERGGERESERERGGERERERERERG